MPKIFTYDQQSQTPEGGLTTRIEDQSAVGDALEKLGQQGEDSFGEIAHENNQDAAKRADLALTSQGNDVLYAGDSAFMGLKGDNAQLAAQPAMAQIQASYDQARAGLNPAARQMFDQVAQPRLAAWQAQVNQHLIDQRQAAMDDVSLQRQQMAGGDYARNVSNDPGLAAASLQAAKSEAYTRAKRNGAGDQDASEAANQAGGDAVTQAAAVQIAYDPERVPGLLADHRGVIASGVAEALSNQATGEAHLAAARGVVQNLVAAHTRSWAPAASALPPDAIPAPDPDTFVNDAVAEAGDDPDRQAVYGQEAMAALAQIHIQRASAIRAATAAAQPYLSDPQVGSLSDLPTLVRLGLPATTRAALIRHFAAGGHPPVSDFETRADLYDLLANAPERFADTDLTGYSTGLSKDDYAALTRDQAAQRQGGPQADARRLQVQTVQGTAVRLGEDIGVTADSDPLQLKAFNANLQRSVDLARARDPDRPLTADAIAGHGRDLIATGGWNRMEGAQSKDMTPAAADGSTPPEADESDPDPALRSANPGGQNQAEDVASAAKPAAARVRAPGSNGQEPIGDGSDGLFKHLSAEGPLDPFLHAVGLQTARDRDIAAVGKRMTELQVDPKDLEHFKEEAASVKAEGEQKAAAARRALIGKPKANDKALSQVAAQVYDAAVANGIPPIEAVIYANFESTLNPQAAHGLFQFKEPTWEQLGGRPEDKHSVDAQVAMFARTTEGRGRAGLARALGRSPEGWELYIEHQQGPTGSRALLKAPPGASASDALSRATGDSLAVARSRIVSNLTVEDLKALGTNPTVAQFLAAQRSVYQQREREVRRLLAIAGRNL